jgi:hypothetical protein
MLRDNIEIYTIYYDYQDKIGKYIAENVRSEVEALGKFFSENRSICYNDIIKIICDSWNNKIIYEKIGNYIK